MRQRCVAELHSRSAIPAHVIRVDIQDEPFGAIRKGCRRDKEGIRQHRLTRRELNLACETSTCNQSFVGGSIGIHGGQRRVEKGPAVSTAPQMD